MFVKMTNDGKRVATATLFDLFPQRSPDSADVRCCSDNRGIFLSVAVTERDCNCLVPNERTSERACKFNCLIIFSLAERNGHPNGHAMCIFISEIRNENEFTNDISAVIVRIII